jgi:hypothetical protein
LQKFKDRYEIEQKKLSELAQSINAKTLEIDVLENSRKELEKYQTLIARSIAMSAALNKQNEALQKEIETHKRLQAQLVFLMP